MQPQVALRHSHCQFLNLYFNCHVTIEMANASNHATRDYLPGHVSIVRESSVTSN